MDFWRDCAAQFGETFTVQLGSLGSIVLFSHPSAVRQIFQLPVEAYECRHYNEQYKYVMGEQSLLLSDGPRHRSRRRLLMPPLHRQTSPEFLRLIQRLTEQAVNDWPMGSPFSMTAIEPHSLAAVHASGAFWRHRERSMPPDRRAFQGRDSARPGHLEPLATLRAPQAQVPRVDLERDPCATHSSSGRSGRPRECPFARPR